MSDIIITEENLSRFTKRLKKALSTHFNQEVPLNLASLILAQTLGVDTIHHLQEILKSPAINEQENEVESIKNFIENYFGNNNKTKFLAFNILLTTNDLSFNLTVLNKESTDQESFAIFFGYDDLSYVSKKLNNLKLSIEDIDFINSLIFKLHFADEPKNIYLGERLKQQLNLIKDGDYYEFKSQKKYEEIANYGLCEKLFVLVNKDFFETIGAPFVLNSDNYSFIDLEKEEVQFFDKIEKGLEAITEDKMLLEFLTPLNQSSKLVSLSKYKFQGICSYYIYKDKKEMIASTVNNVQSHTIKELKDYFFFLGKVFFNIHRNQQVIEQSYSVNDQYKSEILEGFKSSKENFGKKNYGKVIIK